MPVMSHLDEDADFEQRLSALGIDLPPQEIAHLRRTFKRQRAALRSWEERVPPTTEPALVFALGDEGAATMAEIASTQRSISRSAVFRSHSIDDAG